MKKKFIAIIGALAAILIILPFLVPDIEVNDLNDQIRGKLGLRFIRLSDGTVHYRLSGPERGETVVLVHGNAAPYFSWDKNAKALAGAGYRVLVYDLYGFGYSDRPRIEYTRALYDRQLDELLGKLGMKLPVNLIGTSQGGSIAVFYAAGHPGKVKRLALLSPYINILPMKAMIRLLSIPGIGEYLARLALDRINLNYPKKAFADPDAIPDEYTVQYRRQLSFRGFKRARLSNFRNDTLDDFTPQYRAVGGMNIPVLLTWGTSDRLIMQDSIRNIRSAIPKLEYREIAGAGHVAHYEKPGEMNAVLLRFLNK